MRRTHNMPRLIPGRDSDHSLSIGTYIRILPYKFFPEEIQNALRSFLLCILQFTADINNRHFLFKVNSRVHGLLEPFTVLRVERSALNAYKGPLEPLFGGDPLLAGPDEGSGAPDGSRSFSLLLAASRRRSLLHDAVIDRPGTFLLPYLLLALYVLADGVGEFRAPGHAEERSRDHRGHPLLVQDVQ